MNIIIRAYQNTDLPAINQIWNEVVEDGVAFPQEGFLNAETGKAFFAEQTYTAVAEDTDTGNVLGLYILHPNNIGRCGHICNASYAVSSQARGLHIGEKLVSDCLIQGNSMASASCSLMLLLPAIFTRDISMNVLALSSWA